MSRLPSTAGDGRRPRLVLMIALGLAQAGSLGVAAHATRSIFETLHRGIVPAQSLFVALALAAVAGAALRVFGRAIAEAIGEGFANSLRLRLYAHMAGMDQSSLDQRRRGTLSLRFVGDIQAARGWAGQGVAGGIAAAITLVVTTIVFLYLRPALALPALLPVAISMIFAVLLGLRLGARHGAMRANRARMAASMMERIALAPELDLLGRTPKELQRLSLAGETLSQDAVTRRRRLEAMRAMPMIGGGIGGAVILWVTAKNGFPASDAATALAVLSILSLPLGDLVMTWDRYCAWRIARASCLRLLQSPSLARLAARSGHAVSVAYDGRTADGAALSLSIPAGSLAVLSGPPASGKSRLARILAGQDRPEEGTVSYDGAVFDKGAVSDEGLGSGSGEGHRAALPSIAYVSATPLILKGSLRRALTLGVSPRPDPRQIRKVAKLFGLAPLLDRLGSTKAQLSERGADLSLGEQLGIGLTRAVLMQPDLIVIDHPALERPQLARDLVARLREKTKATLVLVGAKEAVGGADMVVDLGK